jgi:hypothetical protein
MSAMYPVVTKSVLKLFNCKRDSKLGLVQTRHLISYCRPMRMVHRRSGQVLAGAPIIKRGILNETTGEIDSIKVQVQYAPMAVLKFGGTPTALTGN